MRCLAVFICLLAPGLLVSPAALHAEVTAMSEGIAWPSRVQGWAWDGEQAVYNRANLFDYIDGAAEVYLSYNFEGAETRRYLKDGRPAIVAELYRMGSSQDAFGLFSLERQDPEAGIGQGSELGGGMLRFWKGRYFVSVFAEGEGADLEEALRSLGRALAASIRETGESPRLLRYIPDVADGSVPGRVCFVRSHILLNRCFFISHQNILGLGPSVEALLVSLQSGKDTPRVLIARYPSEPSARAAFQGFGTAYLPDAAEEAAVKTEDGKWTMAVHHRCSVVIVFGAATRGEADRLSGAVVAKMKEDRE